MASNRAPHLLGFCELSRLHLLFFVDAVRKGVRLIFYVGISFRPYNPGRMCPRKSASVLASIPSSCTEVTQTERVRWTDLSVLSPFQVLPGHE